MKRIQALLTIAVAAMLLLTGFLVLFSGDSEARDTDVIYIGVRTDADTWDHSYFPNGDARFLWSQVYETLVRLDNELGYLPGLATDWESSADLRSWTFHLREGVTFHDGTNLTADAVVFSYNETCYVRNGPLASVISVTAVDDLTVNFSLAIPLELPSYLTHVAWPVMSPTSVGDDGRITEPIGTGPYQYESCIDDVETVLVCNDAYWDRDNMPTLERVVFKVIPDVSTRIMALQSDTERLDMILGVPEDRVQEMEGDSDIEVNEVTTTFTDFLQFNTLSEPFDELAVRQAVAYALDCDAIVDDLLDTHGTAAWGRPYSPIMDYASDDLDLYQLDLTLAAQLLEDAGWEMGDDGVRERDGQRLEVNLLVEMTQAAPPRFDLMSQYIASTLEDIGFEVTLVTNPQECQQKEADGDFGMYLRTGYFVWGPYPKHFLLHTSFFPFSHYANGTYNGMVTTADVPDAEQEEANYVALQQWVVGQLPAYYLAHTHKIVLTRSYVDGYQITEEWPWLNLNGVTIEA